MKACSSLESRLQCPKLKDVPESFRVSGTRLERKHLSPVLNRRKPDDVEMVLSPEHFTGDMPLNALVGMECSNRPDQMPFINAINEAKQSHDDDQIVMTCKCPAAFEWKMNQGWDAEERLQQRIHLEESKDPHLWDGPLGQKTQALKSDLEDAWNNKKKRKQAFWSCIENNEPTLSDREKLLFRWMCIHVTLHGTPTSNPKRGNVFEYIHSALNCSSDFILDSMEEQTGLTGLYSACEYHVSDPTLDTWIDKKMDYVWEQFPISRSEYTRSDYDYNKFMKSIVHSVAVMMHEYQMYHIDMTTALGLTPEDWRVWCMQWHMYKRDYEIARTHLLIPDAGNRYETVCVYLETLTRLEITETETREGNLRQRAVQITPNPPYCPYCNTKYKNYGSVANAATAIWQHCQSCASETLKVKDAGPFMPAFSMKMP